MMLNKAVASLVAAGVLAGIPWVWLAGSNSGSTTSVAVNMASASMPSGMSAEMQQKVADHFGLDSAGEQASPGNPQTLADRLRELRENPALNGNREMPPHRMTQDQVRALNITPENIERMREVYELARPDVDPRDLPDLDQIRPALEPRQPITKRPTQELATMPENATGTLIVKFRDDVRMRLNGQNRLASRTGVDVEHVTDLVHGLGLDIEPAFLRTDRQLRIIETRAAIYSGRDQPDLAGMIHLTGPEHALTTAAQLLNEMEVVEFVEFEREMQTGDQFVTTSLEFGACCTPAGFVECTGCIHTTPEFCFLMNGSFQGDGTACTDNDCGISGACCLDFTALTGEWDCVDGVEGHAACELLGLAAGVNGYFQGNTTPCEIAPDELICEEEFEVECGECTGPCFSPHLTPYCEIGPICDTICDNIDPFCCGEAGPGEVTPGRGPQRWDVICALHAAPFGIPFDPPIHPGCIAAFGPCFETHPSTGCSAASCCGLVCDINPNCCVQEWGAECVQLANSVCAVGDNLKDDLTPLQGYLTPTSYYEDLGGIPDVYRDPPFFPLIPSTELNPFNPLDNTVGAAPGYGGEGYDLALFDALAELLYQEYGIGRNPDMPDVPTSKGETIRVAVIEHSAFVQPFDPEENNHAALTHVISEPNQTILNIPGSANLTGDHGTAVLGIVGGQDRITGIAPEVELYFFPIVSAEEGGRLGRAIIAAMAEFGPGDVMNFSIGPGGGGTLVSDQRNWLLIRMASDMGIISTVSAGNSCANVDGTAQWDDEDSDVIIVGAAYPGRSPGNQHCRLGFSNYCNECDEPHQVHVGAWGTLVTTAGYGDLFFDTGIDDPQLSHYTHTFGGTSAAAPMVAAVAARAQSFSKQFYGIPLTPVQIRNLIAGNGWSQCGTTIAQCEPPGHGTANACPGSWNYSEDGDYIGLPCGVNGVPPIGLTSLFPLGEAVISTEFFPCSPFVDEVTVIRGKHIFGNKFSICGELIDGACTVDGNFLIAESQFTQAGSSPNPGQPLDAPIDQIAYITSGQIVDFLIEAIAPSPNVANLSILTFSDTVSVLSVSFIEVYDFDDGQWKVLSATVHEPGTPGNTVTEVFNPNRFIRNDDQQMYLRKWVLGFTSIPTPGGSTTSSPFEFRFDSLCLDFEGVVDN